MKVLGLVGSPRKLGNSEILVKEMLASLPADVEKSMIRLSDLDIKPCKACYACLPREQVCVIADHLSFLLERIREADAVIIASACYFLGSHTSLKTISDRLICILADSHLYTGKKCVTATVYGMPDWEGYARESVNNFARFLHLDVVGDMLVNAASPGEVVEPAVLQKARELADRLVSGQACAADSAILTCPDCSSSLLQISPAGQVRCVMCNARGTLMPSDTGYAVRFDTECHKRYSPEGMTEHQQNMEEAKRLFITNRQEFYRRRKPYDAYDWWIKPEE